MKIPNRDMADVPRAKIVDYLLSESHPHGRHKAKVFKRLGFSLEQWKQLAMVLKQHANEHDVSTIEQTPFDKV